MASHVTVVSPSARSTTIKTQPGTYLSDIRTEACQKFGLRSDDFILRHNNKALDLSRTVRLAGLAQGAKLELVQGSRSPTSVLVGLQLPDNTRLTEKLASSTTLWQILRHFESKKPGLNLTARSVPAAGQDATAGRLNYEMPILNVMGRERGTFVELQQTLGQLGITKDVLLRLNFRNSKRPLEEAHEEISQYFRDVEGAGEQTESTSVSANTSASAGVAKQDLKTNATPPQPSSSAQPSDSMEGVVPTSSPPTTTASDQPAESSFDAGTSSQQPPPTSHETPSILGPNQQPITIFAPPTTSSPWAATAPHNPSDYDLSVDQAKKYQAHLQEASRNKRLLSDTEIAEQERQKSEKLNAVKDVRLRIRLPDQTQVEVSMNRNQTTAEVYILVRDMLEHPNEDFILRYPGPKGPLVSLKEGTQKLVADLGFQGRTLVTFAWGDNVALDKKKAPTLKKEWREQAQNLKVQSPVGGAAAEQQKASTSGSGKSPAKPKMSDADKESKLKSLLGKTLFKKK